MAAANKLILVTGASGWLGHRLLDILALGHPDDPRFPKPKDPVTLRCLILPGEPAPAIDADQNVSVEIMQGDLRDPKATEQFVRDAAGGVLFHTAGVIHPRRSGDFESINVTGARNLFNAASLAGLRRAVVVSSNSPFGFNPSPNHLFTESSPYRPYMGYGRSKMKVEELAKSVHEAGKLETVIVRPPWFYGPRQPARQTTFFQMIKNGTVPILGSGEQKRSMAYVDNLAQGLLLAAQVPSAAGKAYWIADERPYPMNEIIDTIERVLERDFKINCTKKRRHLPAFASTIAQGVDGTLQALGLYEQRFHVLSEMSRTIACDISLAKKELDYRPTVALEEGMRRSIAWILEHGGVI